MNDQNTPIINVNDDMLAQAMDMDFAAKLDETFADRRGMAGDVVKGIVVGIDNEMATIDIGMKAEGRVALSEFIEEGKEKCELAIGDEVEVFVDSLDDRNYEAQLSREKALREEAMMALERAQAAGKTVEGTIFGRVKGGFAVDVQGVLAFLPGSQLDARPVHSMDPVMNSPLDFALVKVDRKKGNVIVSRRAIMDESTIEQRDDLLKNMAEGQELKGVVKNITDYGAFIDLGGVDGLLHITDISWNRIGHPSEVLKLGETIDVKVTRYDEKTKRVSLGVKQMGDDPWKSVDDKYKIGSKVKGKITNITDYGAFVELAPGVEGLIHVSEMNWTRKNTHPGKVVSTSEEVEVMVLEIDHAKRRISLGLKQCQENPWSAYAKANKEGDIVEGTVRSTTDFGLFIGLTDDIDGLVHVSDISWDKSGEEAIREFKKGDAVKAKILTLDADKERVALGIKQMSEQPKGGAGKGAAKAEAVTATVVATSDAGVTVKLADGSEVLIQTRDLARGKAEQDVNRFKAGEEVRAMQSTRAGKVSLSIKALEVAEEKEAVKAYAKDSSDSSSTLGDLLGDALKAKK